MHPGQRLATPVEAAPFEVEAVDDKGVVFLIGQNKTATRLTWKCLEGIMPFLATRGRVRIGSLYSTDSSPNTLDSYLKRHIKRATAAWVGALLEEAGLVMIERPRPATVWLASEATATQASSSG